MNLKFTTEYVSLHTPPIQKKKTFGYLISKIYVPGTLNNEFKTNVCLNNHFPISRFGASSKWKTPTILKVSILFGFKRWLLDNCFSHRQSSSSVFPTWILTGSRCRSGARRKAVSTCVGSASMNRTPWCSNHRLNPKRIDTFKMVGVFNQLDDAPNPNLYIGSHPEKKDHAITGKTKHFVFFFRAKINDPKSSRLAG